MAVKPSFVPSPISASTEVIDDIVTAANDFSSFNCQVDFTSAGIPQHKFELGSYSFFEELRKSVAGAVCPRRTAFGWSFALMMSAMDLYGASARI